MNEAAIDPVTGRALLGDRARFNCPVSETIGIRTCANPLCGRPVETEWVLQVTTRHQRWFCSTECLIASRASRASEMPEMGPSKWPWWTIYGQDLMWALRQVANGVKPKDVYATLVAGSWAESPKEDDQ